MIRKEISQTRIQALGDHSLVNIVRLLCSSKLSIQEVIDAANSYHEVNSLEAQIIEAFCLACLDLEEEQSKTAQFEQSIFQRVTHYLQLEAANP